MKKIIIVLLGITLIIIAGCSKNSSDLTKKEFSKEKPVYFIHQFTGGVYGQTNEFVFVDSKGAITNLIEIETSSDLSDDNYNFDSNSSYYYMYGPGGLFEIDLANQSVECLSEEVISLLTFDEFDNIYYYENNGFEGGGYNARVCTKDKTCIQFDYPLFALGYNEGNLYVSMSKDNQGTYILDNFSMNKKINSTTDTTFCSMLKKIKDDFYCYNITSLFKIENDKKIPLPFVDELGMHISLKCNLPYITEIEGKTILIDTVSGLIYDVKIKEEVTEMKIIKDLGHGYAIEPSTKENFVIAGNVNFGFKSLNLLTLETEDIKLNYKAENSEMKIRKIIHIE